MLQNPLILLACLLIGFATRYVKGIPENSFRTINKWIIWIPLPAITLEKISQMEMTSEYMIPILATWWVFLGGMIFFGILAKIFNWDKATWAALCLVCGLGNTSFIGFPVIRMLYGEEGIRYAIFVDQPGTFLLLATFGVGIAAYASSGKFSAQLILNRLLKFPPFIAFLIALLLPFSLLEQPIPGINNNTAYLLRQIGQIINPLAFLSIGMQFRFSWEGVSILPYSAGLAYKLILAPFTVWLAFYFLEKEGLMYDITVLELAMPPMITASIIAIEHNLRPKMSSAWINFGTPLAALTILLWSHFLR